MSENHKMTNEERIKKWKEGRAKVSEDLKSARVDDSSSDKIREKLESKEERTRKFRESRLEAVAAEKNEKIKMATAELPTDLDLAILKERFISERKADRKSFLKRVTLFIVLPSFLALLYGLFFKPEYYHAESTFSIKANDAENSQPNFSQASAIFPPKDLQPLQFAKEFIESQYSATQIYQHCLFDGTVRHYSSANNDSRMIFETVKKNISISISSQEGFARLKIRALSEQDAINCSSFVLRLAENHVNNLEQLSFLKQSKQAASHLSIAYSELSQKKAAVLNLQLKHKVIDPKEKINVVALRMSSAEQKLVELKNEKLQLIRSGVSESPLIPQIDALIKIIEKQVSEDNAKITGSAPGSLANVLLDFDTAVLEKDIAQKKWESSLISYQQIVVNSTKNSRNFVLVVPPSLLPSSRYLDALYFSSVTLFFSILIYFILTIVWSLRKSFS